MSDEATRRVRQIVSTLVEREGASQPLACVYQRAYRAVVCAHIPGAPHSAESVPVEVLGGVADSMLAYAETYQRMLGERPVLQDGRVVFEAGEQRRKMGSFYTPPALVDHLVERALGNVAMLRVCDPAVGVGGFLLGAAREMRRRGGEIDVIVQESLYGVDIDPVAVELCRAVLACQTSDPAGVLVHLESRIKVGNALVGARSERIEAGIPGEAFVERPGDVAKVVGYYKRRNGAERRRSLLKQRHEADSDPRLSADAWCAAFVWRRHDTDAPGVVEGCPGEWDAMTQKWFELIRTEPARVQAWMLDEVRRLALEFRFFHWHLEFPEVFTRLRG